MQDKTKPEELLEAWIKLSAIIKNTRVTKGLQYNEATIMRLLYNRYREDKAGLISLKEITLKTRMLKSLVNRTVNSLEKKGLLERCESIGDRRVVYVRCVPENLKEYLSVHNQSLTLAQKIINIIGDEDAEAFVRLTEKIENAVIRPK
ncbi:MAG: MarR family transcriptional regulator [Clostridia bacterium]|nr:MarR family transcriptional regulator [Clostridia bacterium]